MGPEGLAMLSPQPRRAFFGPIVAQQTESNQSWPCSPWSAGTEEARNELHGILGSRLSPDGMRAHDSRPLSAVSTSAGPTPGPDEKLSPQQSKNDGYGVALQNPAGLSKKLPMALPMGAVECKSNTDASAMSSQVRKVFVGGIPQDLTQDELYNIFSEFSRVKKAWLQRYRANAGNQGSAPPHNHRGFGFVIFYDGTAVDQMLGQNFSRFIILSDGRKLEVKRAVSSSDMRAAEDTRPPLTSTISMAGRGAAGPAYQLEQRQAPSLQPQPHPHPQQQAQHAPPSPPAVAMPQSAPWPGMPNMMAGHHGHWMAAQAPPLQTSAQPHSVVLAAIQVPWPGGAMAAQNLPHSCFQPMGLPLQGYTPLPCQQGPCS
mmetsp:Transcript_39363/g.111329  ORF Transcript_39363/g.111329 Transcript_39363/m.111329 type:complete len:372 (+) Transcript_39363:67-1182(+)